MSKKQKWGLERMTFLDYSEAKDLRDTISDVSFNVGKMYGYNTALLRARDKVNEGSSQKVIEIEEKFFVNYFGALDKLCERRTGKTIQELINEYKEYKIKDK